MKQFLVFLLCTLAGFGAQATGDSPTTDQGKRSYQQEVKQQKAHTTALIEHRVVVNHHDFALWEKSAADSSRVILLLHGRTYSSLPDFDLITDNENLSFMDGLVDRGFRVYALDARGYGGTKRDKTGWLTPVTMVEDVVKVIEWITQQSGQQPHLYGWSYGSMVAQMVAQRHPTAVKSLMLFGYPFDPGRHVVDTEHHYPTQPPAKANTEQHAASDFIVPSAISEEGINAYVKSALKADPIRVDVKNLHQWAELDPSKVTIPTLLLQGEFDPLAPDSIQQSLFLNLGTADKWWIVLNGGDHAALLETPRLKMLDTMSLFARHTSDYNEQSNE